MMQMKLEPAADRAALIQLHGVLSDIDPVKWRDEAAVALRTRLNEAQRRLEQRERLAALAGELRINSSELDAETPSADLRTRWLAFKQRIQPAYEAMAAKLRAERIHVPSLRPTNWARSLFHVSSAAVAIAAIELLPAQWVLTTIAFAWACEIGRRKSPTINAMLMRVFKSVAHAHETYRINSATWYATALVLLTLTRSPVVEVVAVAVLGVGDPMAGLIGRRFGRIKLIHGRSLEGTLAFFASGTVMAFGLLAAFHHSLGLGEAAVIAMAAAAFGAVAELVSLRLDDNLSVPLSAAVGALLAMQLV